MKRYYTGLPLIFLWLFFVLFALGGFIWECIDRGKFVVFAFITSVIIPFGVEIVLIVLFGSYITIDKNGIKKNLFGVLLKEYRWIDIMEIKKAGVYVYISLVKLDGELKKWDKKKYICLLYSDKLWKAISDNATQNVNVSE